jgi:hypothetical protein
MSEGEALPWSPIDWSDEDGGTIRLWPHLPTVVSTDALRRTVGDWQGLAFLLPPDEPEDWAEQVVEKGTIQVSIGILWPIRAVPMAA